jgi:hypothetical protein
MCAPEEPQALHPEDYAIVVGINQYPGLKRSLQAAENDATRFVEWLLSPDGGGLPKDNTGLILSSNYDEPEIDFDAQPIQRDIDRALAKFGIESERRLGRRLYFYFAGHGLGLKFNEVALLMANAADGRLHSNLGFHEYREFLREAAPFDEIVFILDCCRDIEDRASPMRPIFTPRRDDSRAPFVRDFVIMGARYGYRAYEPEQPGEQPGDRERRGLLTEALLEGLREKKAHNERGHITAASLREFLKGRVPELAKVHGLTQEPEIPDVPDEFIFGPDVEVPVKHVRVTAAPELNGQVVLRYGNWTVRKRKSTTDLPWDLSLEDPGLYVVEHEPSGQSYTINTREITEEPRVYHFQ